MRPDTRKYNQRARAIIDDAKNKPCSDCGIKYPLVCMQFDHVRGLKKLTIGASMSRGIPEIRAEIAKCEIVCANCHAIRSYERRYGPLAKRYKASDSQSDNSSVQIR